MRCESGDVSNSTQSLAIAAWERADPNWTNVWAARIAAGGNWSAAVRVSDDKSSAKQPVITLDDQGRALALWLQAGALMSSQFTPGAAWSSPVAVSAPGVASATAPVIAVE